MFTADFFNAKNNSLSCRINGMTFHSGYNPENEAKKFVQMLPEPVFFPKFVLLIEPGIGYALEPLKERFPNSKIIAIRFLKELSRFNSGFFKVFDFFDANSEKLLDEMKDYFGEEGILHCVFFQWNPSAQIFKEQTECAWNVIKQAVNFSQTVLATKGFFSKRWIKNSVIFFTYAKKTLTLKKGNCDIFITASGPSLKSSIPFLKKIRNDIFLICVSSALHALLKNGIAPDLVVSTDGGYYAKPHLFALLKKNDIPLAISTEANCSKKTLSENQIVPLLYSDGIGSSLLKTSGLNFISAQRNGTVSGTAAELALSLTDGNVYFCGLDLCPGKGFQHTAPNQLEIQNSAKDCKISNCESRQSRSRFNSSSLKIYEEWFSAQDFNGRLYRISNNYSFSNSLGKIKDINFQELKLSENRKFPEFSACKKNNFTRNQIYHNFLEICKTDIFLAECFPIEYLTYSRTSDSEKKKQFYFELNQKAQEFMDKIFEKCTCPKLEKKQASGNQEKK